jgi:hypothetical protein
MACRVSFGRRSDCGSNILSHAAPQHCYPIDGAQEYFAPLKSGLRSKIPLHFLKVPLQKKRAAPKRMQPEFREETPVTRQREDQPLPGADNGVGSQGGTIRKAVGGSQKTGFGN